jgi:hypothetical protein
MHALCAVKGWSLYQYHVDSMQEMDLDGPASICCALQSPTASRRRTLVFNAGVFSELQ